MISPYAKSIFFAIAFIFCSQITIAEANASSTIIPLYPGWYAETTTASWEGVAIQFDEYQPNGRLSLSKTNTATNIPPEVVSDVYSWQFLDALIDNPLTMSITVPEPVSEDMTYVAYVNTAGTWQQVGVVVDGSTVSFKIESSHGQAVIATGAPEIFIEIPIAGEVLEKGYTIETPTKDVRVGILPNLVSIDFTAKVRSLPTHYSKAFLPDDLHFVSEVYHVWLDSSEGSLPFSRSLPVELAFPKGNDEYKVIYYFDPTTNTWHPSPSLSRYLDDETAHGYIRTLTYQKEMIIAVVANPKIKEWGKASWFSSDIIPRNRLGSANNDLPLGTVVRVTNLHNDKSVDTEIISRGPYADFRIIDLGSDVFKQIASLGAGVIQVKIEPIEKLP